MRLLFAIFIGCVTAVPCCGQDGDYPATISGFLKPGTFAGIRALDASSGITVTIYAEPDFEIALDARRLSLDELAAKYKSVADSRAKTLQEATASWELRRKENASGRDSGTPQVSLFIDRREQLYRIVHVGNDYLLVSYEDNTNRQRAFATKYISSIRWHDELRFRTSIRRSTSNPSSTR